MKHVGHWVQFQTQWGHHRGIVEQVQNHGVLMRVPREYAPAGLANFTGSASQSDEARLDLALAQWGYGAPGYGYGYGGGAPGYGYGYARRPGGYGGYGGWWAGGWWLWWLAFAWIFALAFLW